MSAVSIEIKNGREIERWLNSFAGYRRKRVFQRASVRIKAELLSYVKKIVATWDHTVTREVATKVTNKNMTVTLTINDLPFFFLTVGTRKHPIVQLGPLLAFPWNGRGSYIAKSTKTIGSRAGSGRNIGPIHYFTYVNHPGVRKPREFHELMAKKILPYAVKVFKEELKAELARS